MRTRTRFLIAFAALGAGFGLAVAAQAADCGGVTVLGPMADGLYFAPSFPSAAGGSVAEVCAKLQGAAPPSLDASDPTASATSEPVVPTQPQLIAAIGRARQMLQERIDADAGKKTRVVTSYDVWVDVTLAVWDRRTDGIELVHAGKSGAKLDVDKGADVGISVRYNNGVNSQFAVDDGDKLVVAVRYPIFKDVTVKKKQPRYELHDVVYTPYSEPLRQPELVTYGESTLRGYIAQASQALRAGGVMSRAFPDRSVVDVIDPKLLEGIAVIEHLSEASLSGPNAQDAADAFYAVIGANQDAAYSYARSPAGALGLVQFIPSTYALMVKRADLGLTKDFTAGMSDPVNAIKAQIAYLDSELASMPPSIRDLYSVDQERVDEYLAAAYNGGGARVRKAIAALGDGWSADPAVQKAALQKKYDTLFAEASALKKKILAEDDPAVWKPMQKRLNASRAERAKVTAQMNALTASSLRTETAVYVQKLRNVLKLLAPPPLPQA